ncbi:MAG: SH3 domain-containing protein [Candidatus Omnitrophica bacterium]|nr:SH3 domain-containing protein [Candidatus Omnitrophota bacterium]
MKPRVILGKSIFWTFLAALCLMLAAGFVDAAEQAADHPPAAVPAGNFAKGVDLYKAAKFKEAAVEFGRVAASGTESSAVYFNLGNSWIRSGELGRGIWAYERAFVMDPRDEDIRFNRALVKAALGESTAPEAGILEPVQRLLDYVRTSEVELALQISTILLVLCMLAFAYIRPWRAFFGTIFWITLLVSTLVWGAAWIRWNEIRYPAAVVRQKEVFVRYGPTEADSKARQLKEGASLRIQKQSGDWYLVRLSSGQTGWIPKDSVLKVYP